VVSVYALDGTAVEGGIGNCDEVHIYARMHLEGGLNLYHKSRNLALFHRLRALFRVTEG